MSTNYRYIKSGMIVCMARRTELAAHLTSDELKERYRTCRDAKEARRWQALWQLSLGISITQAAALTGFHRNWVRRLLQRYNTAGPDAIVDQHAQHPGGRLPYLSPAHQHELDAALDEPAPDGGLWTGPKVAAWIATKINRPIHPQLGWSYLRKLGFTLRRPRPQHQDAATAEEQAAWKKN
jgi:transposase